MSNDGILSALIGHDGAKAILRAALRQGGVHVLLEGPPASGKSVALLAIEEHVPGAAYKDAAGFTEVQLRETLARDYNVLCLDEIDAMRTGTYEALSTPMEHGRVTKDTAHDQYDVEIETQLFAACNDESDLPAHTASRFRTISFDEYSHEEFVDVCAVLLPDSVEWVESAETARHIAEAVYEAVGSRDPRDARDAARLAGERGRVADMAKALADPTADVDSVPITPEEIDRLHRGAGGPDGYGPSNPLDRGGRDPDRWETEACQHLVGSDSADAARQFGRFLCPRCANEYGAAPTTPISEAAGGGGQ